MACSLKLSALVPSNSIPRLQNSGKVKTYYYGREPSNKNSSVIFRPVGLKYKYDGGSTRLRAGLSEIETDLNEDPKDRWATNGVESEDFIYGKYDGHHTFYESDDNKVSFWGSIAEDYAAVGPPTGFQGLISWLFLPAIAVAMYMDVPGEYLYGGAAIFTVVFCIIEMDKPSEAHNFEPEIYNMERGARDKLIADYNTMDIWDFNEKYGDIWDFTIKKESEDIIKR